MYCGNCGNQVGAGNQFCSNCGTPVGSSGGNPDATSFTPPVAPVGGYPPPPGGIPPPPGATPTPPPQPPRNSKLWIEIAAVFVLVVILGTVIGVLLLSGDKKSSTKTAGASHTASATGSTDTGSTDTTDTSSDTGGSSTTHPPPKSTTTTPTLPPTTLDPVAKARADDAAGYTFMTRLETLLQRANNGRSEVGPLIAAVQDNCSRNPDDAVNAIASVVNNRQSILDEIASTSLNPGTFQADLAVKFQKAMSTSIETDRAYSRWLAYVRDYYYRPPQGCLGNPPQNSDWDDAQAGEAQVTPAKADFITAYNTQAVRFGMKTWTVDEI